MGSRQSTWLLASAEPEPRTQGWLCTQVCVGTRSQLDPGCLGLWPLYFWATSFGPSSVYLDPTLPQLLTTFSRPHPGPFKHCPISSSQTFQFQESSSFSLPRCCHSIRPLYLQAPFPNFQAHPLRFLKTLLHKPTQAPLKPSPYHISLMCSMWTPRTAPESCSSPALSL